MDDAAGGVLPQMFALQGIYAEQPYLDGAAWQEFLIAEFGATDLVNAQSPLLFAFTEHLIDYEDRKAVPAMANVLPSSKPLTMEDFDAADIGQSWTFPDVENVLPYGRHSLLVTEFMARNLPRDIRHRLFVALIRALLTLTNPIALYNSRAGAFYDPEKWRQAYADGDLNYGLFNVRCFNVSNHGPNEAVMDSRGLDMFALPDLQCHFRDLDYGDVSHLLYSIGYYLINNGPIIEDGHTVPGIPNDATWQCHYENALIGPQRIVLDICPHSPHAAGNRG